MCDEVLGGSFEKGMGYFMKHEGLSRIESNQQYIATMRPLFNKKAIYSDTTEEYVSPYQPAKYELVKIRCRTGKNNVDNVYLVCGKEHIFMTKSETEGDFDYYECALQLSDQRVNYYFEIKAGNLTVYFDARGMAQETNADYGFVLIPGYQTPDWAKGAVMYQIYVDRFCNGDLSNDVETGEYCYINEQVRKVEDWKAYPSAMDVRSFYGGDLQGVLDKLDYLQELGIEAIYFNPLFVSPSNHKYDSQDYDYIDPHLGRIVADDGELLPPGSCDNSGASKYIMRVTNRDNLEASNTLFAKVVEEAHKRGMKVLLDGVFNHCGSFNKWIDRERIYENQAGYEKGAYVSADSPYRYFFDFKREDVWPYNATYDGWWGHNTLPKLNYEKSRQLMDYILYIGRKWVSPPYNADGWRLDVAADLGHSPEFNHYFWQEFRHAVKQANPNALILAEHYGDTKDWLQGDQWDTVMNYDAFMEPVTWFLTGMEKHSDDYREDLLGNSENFWASMIHHTANFSMPTWQTAMNQLSNHDHSRFLTRTNHKVGRTGTLGPEAAERDVNKAVFREGVVLQMTWMGAPTIYYGDEAGLCGFTDPDNRRTYPWGHEDQELIAFHRDLIRIRKENQELKTGSIKDLDSDYQFLSYGRFTRKGQIAVFIYNGDVPYQKEVSVWELGIPKTGKMRTLLRTDVNGYSLQGPEFVIKGGKIHLEMRPFSAFILKFDSEKV